MTESIVAVIGTTGQVGLEVLRCLQASGTKNRLLLRDVNKGKHLLDNNTSIAVPFDMMDPATYEKALHTVNRLFLTSNPEQLDHLPKFLDVAEKAGLEQIVFISGMGIEENPQKFTALLEKMIQERPFPSISLRCNWFMQNYGKFFRDMVVKTHLLTFPDDGAKISFIDAKDIAEVAAHFLTTEITSGVHTLTGSEALSQEEVAALFSKALPYEVKAKNISDEEARKLGWGEDWIEVYQGVRKKIHATVTEDVQKILNKPARTFAEYIQRNKALWT